MRSSKTSNGNNQNGVNSQPQQVIPNQLQQFQNMPQTVQGQLPPGMFPANYFPYIATDPQTAFKKKPGFSEEEKLSTSKVSKVSKATSKLSRKEK